MRIETAGSIAILKLLYFQPVSSKMRIETAYNSDTDNSGYIFQPVSSKMRIETADGLLDLLPVAVFQPVSSKMRIETDVCRISMWFCLGLPARIQ